MKLYRVANWDENFENNRTRDLDNMKWVPIPNKHDGEGFADLLSRESGMALYGAWILILQVASKCDKRGTLLRTTNGMPHTAETIARQSRGDSVLIAQSLSILVEIGWLTEEEWQTDKPSADNNMHETADGCGQTALKCDQVPSEVRANDYGKERKGKEEKTEGAKQPALPAPTLKMPEVLNNSNFRTAWSDWIAQRKALKIKPYTPQGAQGQLDRIAAWGSEGAISAIRHSIAQNSQGIYPEKGNGKTTEAGAFRFAGDPNELPG